MSKIRGGGVRGVIPTKAEILIMKDVFEIEPVSN